MKDETIERMLTLSTSHLREQTCNEWLAGNLGAAPVTTYPKGEYGRFVYCGDPESFHAERFDGPGTCVVPNDLIVVVNYARERGCTWVCFDQDADQIKELMTYDW